MSVLETSETAIVSHWINGNAVAATSGRKGAVHNPATGEYSVHCPRPGYPPPPPDWKLKPEYDGLLPEHRT